MQADIRGDDSVTARCLAVAILSAVAVTSTARAREASPQMVVCHDYATKKYIADFRQMSALRISLDDEMPTVVAVFQNDSLRYEDYLAECMKRKNLEEAK